MNLGIHNFSLARILTWSFIALSITVLVVTSVIQIGLNLFAQQSVVIAEEQIIAIQAASEVSAFIGELFHTLEAIDKIDHPIGKPAETQENLVKNLLSAHSAFREVALIDKAGYELVRLSRLQLFGRNELRSLNQTNLFAHIRENERYVGPIVADRVTDIPITIMAVPINTELGNFDGGILAEIELKNIWDLVQGLQVGENGIIYVVNRDGDLLASQANVLAQLGTTVTHVPIVADFINHDLPNNTLIGRGINDQYVLSTYVSLNNPDWAVVVELPLGEAYQPLLWNLLLSVGSAILIAIFAGVAGRYLARNLAKPLHNLNKSATTIAMGDIELIVEPQGTTEMQQLAQSFNTMTHQLVDLIQSLEERVINRTQRLITMAELSGQLNALLNLEQLLVALVTSVKDNFDYHHVQIYLIEESQQTLYLGATTYQTSHAKTNPHLLIPLTSETKIIAKAARVQDIVSVELDSHDKDAKIQPLLTDSYAEIAIPIMFQGTVIGVLDVHQDNIVGFDLTDQELLRSLANQIGGAITNARLYTDSQLANKQLKYQRDIANGIREVATVLNSTLELENVIDKILHQLKQLIAYDSGGLFLKDDASLLFYRASETAKLYEGTRIPLDSINLTVRPYIEKQVIIIDDVQTDPGWEVWDKDETKATIHSWMGAPLIVQGEPIGVLTTDSYNIAAYTQADGEILSSFANQASHAIHNARLFAQTQKLLQETETLYSISQKMMTANNLSQLVSAVAESLALPMINRATLLTFEYDNDTLVGLVSQGIWYSGHGIAPPPLGTRYGADVIATMHPFLISDPVFFADVPNDPILPDTVKTALSDRQIGSMALLPLIGQGGRQLGVLAFEGEEPNQFSDNQIRPYLSVLGQLATAVENRRLFDETVQAKEDAERAREEAETAKERAEWANQAKNRFLSNISHELRTPLNGILGYTQILQREDNVTSKQIDGLNVIQQSGEHLLTLINDILDVAKIEAGKLELVARTINLEQLIERLCGPITLQAEKKGLLFEAILSAELPKNILIDDKRLRQILLNLLSNAIKFTDVGQICLKISAINYKLSKSAEKSDIIRLQFAVTDSGIGIPSEQLNTIFDPFEQVGNIYQKSEGTGLGLAITKQLVEAMGGQLQVQSEYGVGSTFTFEIMVPKVDDAIDVAPILDETIIGYKDHRRKILVVDDKPFNQSVLINILEPLGFEMYVAGNGLEAIEHAKINQPDVIVMDMVMPVMTGFEAVQAIRKIPSLKQVIILGASASILERDKAELKIAGCDDFLSKPINVQNLLERLDHYLDIEWIYEGHETNHNPTPDDNVTDFQIPSHDQMAKLYRLVERGSMRKIRRWAEKIADADSRFRPFAEQVDILARTYDSETIEILVKKYYDKSLTEQDN